MDGPWGIFMEQNLGSKLFLSQLVIFKFLFGEQDFQRWMPICDSFLVPNEEGKKLKTNV